MNIKRKKILGIMILLWISTLFFLIQSASAFKNCPYHHPNPKEPAGAELDKYIFQHDPDSEPHKIKDKYKSDYGTHDWIADAALRLLYNEDPSQWNWLLHNKNDENPQWPQGNAYANSNNEHYAIRSYIYFLLATQWPDGGSANNPLPKTIYFEEEKEIIGDRRNHLGVWIGFHKYHNYRYNVYKHTTVPDYYYFEPKPRSNINPQKAPHYADKMGNLAIKCLAKDEKDDNNVKGTKIEAGSFYLGLMTHYISDLACPPHLLQSTDTDTGAHYYHDSFHEWFENQVRIFTYWNPDSNNVGPYEGFFDINLGKYSKTNIKARPPGVAASLLAYEAIITCFGEVGGGNNGSIPLGLYISNENSDLTSTWKWNANNRPSDQKIVPDGITKKQYFDKTEKLLNLAIYYTACAMKYVRDEVNKKGGIDPDFFLKNPYPDGLEPVPLLDGKRAVKFLEEDTELYEEEGKGYKYFGEYKAVGMMIAIAAPVMILVVIPEILRKIKEEELEKFIEN